METIVLPPEVLVGLQNLAQELGLKEFDLLLIADGSGNTYAQCTGWGCLAYDVRKHQAVVHTGGLSCGTNNFAELFPFIQALYYHGQSHDRRPATPVRVQLVSDSEVTVCCGNRVYGHNANGCFWAALSWFEKYGYQLIWRHVPRNSNHWNALVDALAGRAREVQKAFAREVDNVLKPSPGPSSQAGPVAPGS
jgi:ribonuclease HI